MATKTSEPLFHLKHSRFAKQDGWKVYDLSLSLSGNIAISGGNENTRRTFIDIYHVKNSDSRDNPKVIYSKEFEVYSSEERDYWARLISFVGSDDSQITSCLFNKLELFDVGKDEVLRSRFLNGRAHCLFVRGEEILISFFQSNTIAVYDTPDLNVIKSIILQGFGIEDVCWPCGITVATGRFFVCVGYDGADSNFKSLILEENSGKFVSELTKPTGTNWFAECIEVCASLGVVAVVWYDSYYIKNEMRFQVVFYSLLGENDSNFSFLKVDLEFGVLGIRISDRGDKVITWNKVTSEVKAYDMAEFFNYVHFKKNLASQLQTEECSKLAGFFALPKDKTDTILQSVKPTEKLLLALENAGVIQPHNVERLTEAFIELEINLSCYTLVDFFQKTRLRGTLYDRFLATLSAHLTSSLAASLCEYFDISEEKKSITTSQNPGLSVLLALDEKGVIKPSTVVALEQPFTELRLVQALAKVHEYQSTVDEEINQRQTRFEKTEEGKKQFFIQCLRSKIKSCYETMTPVPWKKSCRWTSLDLFVGSGLVITESKATRSLTNVDEKCKLQYTQILTHDRLKTEKRIILEGDPGSGKTTMSSQIAYDWSQGKISDVDILILLPLKFVHNVTLVEAMKRFYFPSHDSITVHDIESFLTNQYLQSCLILDGLEEYNSGGVTSPAEPSEVVKVMEKSKYPNCKVILTSRLDYAKDLPQCPMLRIGRFGETERNTYIEKLFVDNIEKQQAMKRVIENTPFILDLCSVPLLFVLAVHNIESMEKLKEGQLDKISPFIENVVGMLCSSSDFTTQQRVSDLERVDDISTLEEFAYNGLCKGRQILSWRKDTLERNIPNLNLFIESGILIVEEGILKGKLRSVQNEKYENVLTEKNKEQEKTVKEKDAASVDVASSNAVKLEDAESSLLPQVSSAEKGSKENVSVGEPSKKESSSEFESESGNTELQKNSLERSTKDFPLEVKFLHKVIQEWFASKHFSSVLWKSLYDNSHQELLSHVLPLIIPTDLHYILRFTSYLCPPICHLIMGFLLQNHRTGEDAIPEYIMNYICLCYNEYKGQMDPQMKNIVAKVCKEVIVVRSDDSKILQQSKMALMRSAANAGILIKEVHFADIVSEVGENNAKLNADVTFDVPTLNRIEVIEMSRWDQHLKEKDYRNILKLLLCSHSLKKARLHFPSHPPEVDNEEGYDLATHNKTVEWIIGSGLVHSLNMDTGKWEVTFDTKRVSSSRSTKQRTAEASQNATMLSVESTVSNDGGLLEIAGTGVTLIIPPDALEKTKSNCLIRMKIIHPGSYNEASTSFCSNSSVIVELLPNNLRFQHPVELILPHCLQLKKDFEHKARIFLSHHERDEEPRWEEATELNYILADRTCTIWLKTFCWTKIEIDDEIVEGKWIQVYTAAEPICVPDDIAEIEVGYHVDLPGAGKILEWNKSLIVGQRKPYFFLKEGKHPLRVFLEKTLSDAWKYSTPEENPKEIPFRDVALSTEFSCPFILTQDAKNSDMPTCIFKASQNEKGLQLRIRPKAVPTLHSPSRGHSANNGHHEQYVITQDEGNKRMQNIKLKELQRDTKFEPHLSNSGDKLNATVRLKVPTEREQDQNGYDTANNAVACYQPHEARQTETETLRQIATYHEYQMSLYRGLHAPVPFNPLIQQTWYNQHVSVLPQFGGSYISYGLLDGNGESQGGFSLKYSLIQALARKLDPDDPLGDNWKKLADKLDFTMEEIEVFETQHQLSKTHAVIDCARKRGKLKSLEHLKVILKEIGRSDAASLINTDSAVD